MARLPVMNRSKRPGQWAYVYQLVSSLDDATLATINEVLVEENSRASRGRTSWTARLVIEEGHARILVVSESHAQDRKVNRRLEAQLRELGTEFSVTVPMAIGDDITPITGG